MGPKQPMVLGSLVGLGLEQDAVVMDRATL